MAAMVEREFRFLHDSLGVSGPPGPSTSSTTKELDPSRAQRAVTNISQNYIGQELREKERGYYLQMLFGSEYGAISFLRKTLSLDNADEFQECRVELLETLISVCVRYGKQVSAYTVDLKNISISLFTREKTAKIKILAIQLLIQVLKQTAGGTKISEELDIVKLIEKFMSELMKPASKHSPTVKSNLYHLLGTLAELYPEHMIGYAPKLLDLFVASLKTEMTSKTKKPEMSIITGCFEGLSGLLVNFTQSSDDDGSQAFSIYKYTRMSLDKNIKHTRYEMPKAALKLIARHSCQFRSFLMDEHQKFYDTLKFWSRHFNREVKHFGSQAFTSFLEQIAEVLVSRANKGHRDTETFMFFLQEFRSILNNPESTSKEISLAIKGYGLLAAPCRMFLSESDVKFMFTEMMHRSEQIYFGPVDDLDDRLINLPSFLEAFACIVNQLEKVSESFFSSLERLVVVLMEHHPKLHFKLHYSSVLSIIKVYYAVSKHSDIFQPFLSNTVYQGLIRTCSHQIVLETGMEINALTNDVPGSDQNSDDVYSLQSRESKLSYKDYLELWKVLLTSDSLKDPSLHDLSLDRCSLARLIYDELLISVLRVLNRLDLTSSTGSDASSQSEDGGSSSDVQDEATDEESRGQLSANKPKDIIIFINLVEFLRKILLEERTELFGPWMYKFGYEVIVMTTEFRMISGLYKLLTICLQLCTKLQYFKGMEELNESCSSSESADRDFKLSVRSDKSRSVCFQLFSKFIREVSQQCLQFSDELLASCLILILSVPKEILIIHVDIVVLAVQKALVMGYSYLPLASVALNALEQWNNDTTCRELIQPHYQNILPLLDTYLKSGHSSGEANSEIHKKILQMSTKKGRHKVFVRSLRQEKGKNTAAAQSQDSELSGIKRRCFKLLGQVGGEYNHSLISNSNQKLTVSWCHEKLLKFDVPFVDMKPSIYLDEFLPRVAELACMSSDRQTKVAACELLHSLVLFLIGRGAGQMMLRGATAGQSMAALYEKLLPYLIKLSCDIELVARQLFEPLMLQLIHWLTSRKMSASPDTQVLLDSIMEGLVNPDDVTVRDFSAVCLKEFVEWTLKQSTKKDLETSAHSMKSMLKRLFSLARHPSPYKRLGAALGFNSIYQKLREEESLVDTFTFEILVEFIESLAMADTDDKSLGTQTQCCNVLNHVERIIKVKAKLLNSPSKQRRLPKGWTECSLRVAVLWLLTQTGRPQTACRHACMKLVYGLCQHIEGVTSRRNLFDKILADNNLEGANFFISRFENQAYQESLTKVRADGLAGFPNLASLKTLTLSSIVGWFHMFLAALDCYTWTFEQDLLNPASVLIRDGTRGSRVIEVVTYFLSDVTHCSLHDVMSLNQSSNMLQQTAFTPRESELFNREKCTVLVRCLNFICSLYSRCSSDDLSRIFKSCTSWSHSCVWKAVMSCILDPTSLGFNMADIEIMTQLPMQLKMFLSSVKKHKDLMTNFSTVMDTHITKFNWTEELSLNAKDSMRVKTLSAAYKLLYETGFLTNNDKNLAMSKDILFTVFKNVSDKSKEGSEVTNQLTPEMIDTANHILQLSFLLMNKSTNILLDLIIDGDSTEKVKAESSSKLVQKSSHSSQFYVTFNSVINSYLLQHAESVVDYAQTRVAANEELKNSIGDILISLVQTVNQNVKLRHKHGTLVANVMFDRWNGFQAWWKGGIATLESKQIVLNLLAKLILIDSTCGSKSKSFSTTVYSMYCMLLTDRETNLQFKGKVLDLLIFFITLPDTVLLRQSLDSFVADNFPLKSSEYSYGSIKYTEYVAAFKKLLVAMEMSGSTGLLELIIGIMCREVTHICEDDIQNTLIRSIKRQNFDGQYSMLNVVRGFCLEEKSRGLTSGHRRAVIDRVLMTQVKACSSSVLNNFFTNHISDVMSIAEANIPKNAGDGVIESTLTSKLCCYLLIDVMYARLGKDFVHSKNSSINQTYCRGTRGLGGEIVGKEMTTAVTKLMNTVKSEDTRECSAQLTELYRLCHCAAYNALISVISRTQTELKFYNGFLFAENVAKGQLLWENLVDVKKSYEFPVELEAPVFRRQKYITIREEMRVARQSTMEDEDGAAAYNPSVHYLASQYLADSSLNADVSQFDFAASVVSLRSSQQQSQQSSQGSTSSDKKPAAAVGESTESKSSSTSVERSESIEDRFTELDSDELNRHECMAPLVALVNHLSNNIMTSTAASADDKMPVWMENLNKKMLDSSCPINVKLFLAKLIVNCQQAFKPYAGHWFMPLIQLITSSELSSTGINYYISDIVVTMLSWHQLQIPQDTSSDRAMVNHVLQFLMSNCHNDTRSILKNNLEILKAFVEVWKPRIDVPTRILYDNMSERDVKSTRNFTGIQMIGVIVANGLNPFRPNQGVTKDVFYRQLAMCMTNEHKNIYMAAAEVVGMTLKLMSPSGNASLPEEEIKYRDDYIENICKMLLDRKPDQLITCVHRLQLHYPEISDRLMAKMLYMLPKVHGVFKTQCLEIVLARVGHVENLYLELKSKGMLDILSFRDNSTQLTALKVINAMVHSLQTAEVVSLVPALTPFILQEGGSEAESRTVVYSIFMSVYDQYRDDLDAPGVGDLLTTTKEILLRGLSDENETNRLRVRNFWGEVTRLPTSTVDRLTSILESLYSPDTESQYLSYATNFLMELTTQSPDYNRPVFEQPLAECKFIAYSVQHEWKQRHAAMTPLFVGETQQSQSQVGRMGSLMGDDNEAAGPDETVLRQTLAEGQPAFTPTQAGRGPGVYNWLTQSNTLDTLAAPDSSFSLSDGTLDSVGAQSSLLFTIGTGSKKTAQSSAARGSKYKVDADFGKKKLGQGSSTTAGDKKESEESAELLQLKRRFFKRKEEDSKVFFMKRQIRTQKQREKLLEEQKQRREHEVTLYRKYRAGDLPDIQIPYSSIIAPLQALAQKDAIVAKLLFGSLMKSIISEIVESCSETESHRLLDKMSEALTVMLRTSVQYSPPLVSSILDVAYKAVPSVQLDPGVISQASLSSSLQPLGILLLEEMIVNMNNSTSEPSAKRMKKLSANQNAGQASGAGQTSVIDLWLELSRLYKSLPDYDVLRGIFSSRLGTDSRTRTAIEAEMKGDYYTAAKIYTEGLQSVTNEGSDTNELELDFWEETRLMCYDKLGQWEKLEKAASSRLQDDFTSVDSVWEDEIFRENYLPFLVRSKLKQLLSGSANQQALLTFVDNSKQQDEKRILLETKYSEELALLHLWQDDYKGSAYYCNIAQDFFFQEWSGLDDLLSVNRSNTLQTVQRQVELQEFLHLMNSSVSTVASERLVSSWMNRLPSFLTDSLSVWDDVVTNRCVYMNHISHRIQSATDTSSQLMETNVRDNLIGRLIRDQLILRLHQVDAARLQNNFHLALQILKVTQSAVDACDDSSVTSQWAEMYTATHISRCRAELELSIQDKIKALYGAKRVLEKSVEKAGEGSIHEKLLLSDMMSVMTSCLQSDQLDYRTISSDVSLAKLAGCLKAEKRDEILSGLIERGYQFAQEAVSAATASSNKHSLVEICSSNLALYKYCDQHLRHLESDEVKREASNLCPSEDSFPSTAVRSLLQSLSVGGAGNQTVVRSCKEARRLVPRLLQIVAKYPKCMDTFINNAKGIACWQFISSISQMTAILDKPESTAVHDILLQLARMYPQALVYPLKLSSEGYQFSNSDGGRKSRKVCEELQSLVNSNLLIERLIQELLTLDQPNAVFKEWYADVFSAFTSKDQQRTMRAKIDELISFVDERLLGRDSEVSIGGSPYWIKFKKQFGSKIEKLCSTVQKAAEDATARKKFQEEIVNLTKEMTVEFEKSLKPPSTLKEYSPWLSNFNSNHFSETVEIPGQYTGDSKPMPEYHKMISGFQEGVLVMTSLRRPKRLTVRGNDEKDYKYLCKCGEDLRQDQRIQWLFLLMNDIYTSDASCRQRDLTLRTYQVVPMTSRLGIIEWMEKTIPLKNCLLDVLTEDEKKSFNSKKGPHSDHQNLMGSDPRGYYTAYEKVDRKAVTAAFSAAQNKIPPNLLQRAYMRMSPSPEAYFKLRTNFAVTHAQICSSHYVLGIGDRHQSNYMIDLNTGAMVGIDFGHAFGSATQFLPIPELVPFRMTRQLRNFLEPHKEKGLMEGTMIHCMQALRLNADTLINAMDIFIQEPSLDWKQNAERQKKQMQGKDDNQTECTDWYPRQKVKVAQRKLKGDNCAHIMRTELQLGHGRQPYYKFFEKVLMGDKDDNIRARLPEHALTVEQQVACLLDLATDPNVLGRVYIGWEPWM